VPDIKLKNVTKRYGSLVAIDSLSLSIRDGEYLCILGPTGAGKTTLLKLIAGVVKPTEGSIYCGGELMNNLPPEERGTALMFQSFALFPHLTVLDNVLFGPLSRGMNYKDAFKIGMDTLDLVKLARRASSYPNELSGGMQQRVALARSLASGAKILLLDEPLGALDARLRTELRRDIKNLVKDLKLTAVHVTHDQEEALSMADRIALLRNGRIEQVDTPISFYSHPQTIFAAHFLGGANLLEGVVKKTSREGCVIHLGGNIDISASDRNCREGKLVVIGVRLERTYIGRKAFKENSLLGRVSAVRFLGGFVKYDVALSSIENTVSCMIQSKTLGRHEVGEDVYVHFNPDDCIVFSSPRHGLLREIEVF
jgi:ABC-type Fe3+/spermidine/putrescine transport system ATPase subunit